jgi:hypothetical protein
MSAATEPVSSAMARNNEGSLLGTLLHPMCDSPVAVPDGKLSRTMLLSMRNRFTRNCEGGVVALVFNFGTGDTLDDIQSFKGVPGAARDMEPLPFSLDLRSNYRFARVVGAKLSAYSDVQLAGATDVSGRVHVAALDTPISWEIAEPTIIERLGMPGAYSWAPLADGASVCAPLRDRPFTWLYNTNEHSSTSAFKEMALGGSASNATTNWLSASTPTYLSTAATAEVTTIPQYVEGIVRLEGRIDLDAPADAAGTLEVVVRRHVSGTYSDETHVILVEVGEQSFNIDVTDHEDGVVEYVQLNVGTTFDTSPGTIARASTSVMRLHYPAPKISNNRLIAYVEGAYSTASVQFELDLLYEVVPDPAFLSALPRIPSAPLGEYEEMLWILQNSSMIEWAVSGRGGPLHAASFRQVAKRAGRFGRRALASVQSFLASPAGQALSLATPYGDKVQRIAQIL